MKKFLFVFVAIIAMASVTVRAPAAQIQINKAGIVSELVLTSINNETAITATSQDQAQSSTVANEAEVYSSNAIEIAQKLPATTIQTAESLQVLGQTVPMNDQEMQAIEKIKKKAGINQIEKVVMNSNSCQLTTAGQLMQNLQTDAMNSVTPGCINGAAVVWKKPLNSSNMNVNPTCCLPTSEDTKKLQIFMQPSYILKKPLTGISDMCYERKGTGNG